MMDEQTTKDEKLFDPTDSIDSMTRTLDKFLDAAKVEAVYGAPVQNGDTVVIPAAEVFSVLGFGVGTGGGRDANHNIGGGGGGGGGGRTIARPVAAVVVSPNGVWVEPIVDITKVWLAGLTTAGFMVAMIARMSGKRARRST